VLATANMASVCLGQDEWAGRPYPAGLFRAVCRIPPNLLNEGRYSVTALVMTDNQTVQVQVNDVIAFTVHETGEMRREFTGRWIGVVRPRLEWRTEYRSPETTAWN
jgi:lipopolysaccharide transport system ATP-binding protein